MVWGFMIPEPFDYAVEALNIKTVYNRYSEWYRSVGKVSNDWYQDCAGHINYDKLF